MRQIVWIIFCGLLAGCVGVPDRIEAVRNFDVNQYLGKWYEIARLDHPFERGLERVSAEYRRRDDGGLDVLNRGFDVRKKEWRQARGRAYFVTAPDVAQLKVSFFGPFFGGYNVIFLDQETYSYALVCGPSRRYLWLLARRPDISSSKISSLVATASKLGFDTDALIYVQH